MDRAEFSLDNGSQKETYRRRLKQPVFLLVTYL